MANIIEVPAPSPTPLPINNETSFHEIVIPRLWGRIALGAVLLLSIFMNFFLLGQNGYGNLYYAAGIRSMADNWHNFFFVSFDPGGFVTIDKPPFGFWLQTLSTKIFGFTAFSIFLPQALCGVLAVWLLYALVRRHFGELAGLVAALALAVTPISVVTNRNNTIDSTLALALLLAAWAVIHASETGKLRWLLLSGVFVGLGFNIKMAEAYLVVPALGMTYLLCAPRKIWTRIWHLLVVLLVMFMISVSWAAAVDLTPMGQRPYVGSTQDNSELSLAFGYNGLSRLRIGGNTNGRNPAAAGTTKQNTSTSVASNANSGGTTKPLAQNTTSTTGVATATPTNTSGPGAFPAAGAGNFAGAQAAGGFAMGGSGPFRLFSTTLGGQIAWLLPFAVLALLALLWRKRPTFQNDRQQIGLVLWGFWLLTMATFFTLDGSFHQYYMTEMAPGLSALVGIGLVIMWQQYRSPNWRGWLLPIALIATAAGQLYMLASYPSWSQWLSPLIGILTALVVIALILFRWRPQLSFSTTPMVGTAISVGMLALLIAPTVWAGYSVFHNTESSFPTAGPTAQSGATGGGFAGGGFAGGNASGQRADRERTGGTARGQTGAANFAGFAGGGSTQVDTAMITYLEAQQGTTKFLLATPSSSTADAIILSTNRPVMALGGFGGSDPILTTSTLQGLISDSTVRFFLISGTARTTTTTQSSTAQGATAAAGRGGTANSLSTWISAHCSVVQASAWQTATKSTTSGNQLYDCASAHS